MPADFSTEVENAVSALRMGEVILFPTDTGWGLGCDATAGEAVKNLLRLKQRDKNKSFIILVADERDVLQYVAAPDLAVFDFLAEQQRPTTVIYDGAINLPDALLAEDGTVAIRMVHDVFCRHLVKRLRKPIVTTSANISGQPSPAFYAEISENLKQQVDYIVKWRQEDKTPSLPSQIVRLKGEEVEYIRK